jgi:hypothetical protein
MSSTCRPILIGLLTVSALAACKPSASNSENGQEGGNAPVGGTGVVKPTSAASDQWVLNGATACAKYLTPEVITAVFGSASGDSQKTGSNTCTFSTAHAPNTDYSTINIVLNSGRSAFFDEDIDTKNGTPLNGVGDKAVRTLEDAVQALKGDHVCKVYVKPPYGNKLQGDALALKLGEVCNKLFSLP